MLDDGLIMDSYINSIKPTCIKNIPELFMGIQCEQEREEEGEGVIKELDLKSIRPSTFMGPPETSPASRATSV